MATTLTPMHTSLASASTKDASTLLVTVITPTYNQAQYIAACIESVLAQTHRHIEYFIYDACSTDETDKVVARYLNDPRIRYIREADSGQANAINKGFGQAVGDIVCWLNSDDYLFDEWVLDQVCRVFAAHPNIDVVTGDGYLATESGALASPLITPNPACISPRWMATADYFLQPATFWRRNELRLDEKLSYAFDWKFFVAMYQSGRSVFYFRRYLAVYRPHNASKTTQDNARRKHEIYHVLKFARASLLQLSWVWMIFALYAISEALHFPPIKRLAHFANSAMKILSGNRIFSC